MHTAKETLEEARAQLKENLSLLAQLKGNTPASMLADFKLRYVTPLEELIKHLQQDVRKEEKADGSDEHATRQPRQSKKRK